MLPLRVQDRVCEACVEREVYMGEACGSVKGMWGCEGHVGVYEACMCVCEACVYPCEALCVWERHLCVCMRHVEL